MKLKKFDLSMILPAMVPGTILVTLWLEIFIRNSSCFTLSMADAFFLAGAALIVISLLIYLFFYAISFFTWHKWVIAGVPGVCCAVIFQYHLGPELFGTNIYFSEITMDFLLLGGTLFLLLILPVAAALLMREKCYKWRTRFSLVLIFTQAVILLNALFTVRESGDSYDFKEYSFSESEKFSFGTKGNIIVLVVDCMGERIMKEVLVRFPELQTSLKDFTCFDRMVSPLPRTMYAVPAMLTGIDFPGSENGVPEDSDHGKYLTNACREKDSLLQLARKNGFRVEGYPFLLQTISYAPEVIDNSEVISQEVRKDSIFKILEVIQTRLIPVFIKPFLPDNGDDEIVPFVQRGVSDDPDALHYDQNFYKKLNSEFRSGSREKIFKYLHIHGAHDPVMTDENLVSKKNVLKYQQLRGSLRIVELLLQKLKEHGIYDSSTIVITGDHTEKYTPEIVTFIKRPFDKHAALHFNSLPCRVAQISGTVAKSAGLDLNAPSFFDHPPVPGDISSVRDSKQQFPVFTAWKKLEHVSILCPDSTIQGNHLLHGKRIMIELAGDNTIQSAGKITVTAENMLTADQYQTTSIKGSGFRDILIPELALPDGDYLLSVTESEFPRKTKSMSITRVIPGWFRIKNGETSSLPQTPDLFQHPVFLGKKMVFHPFVSWRGMKLSSGCTAQWGCILVPQNGTIRLRLPKPSVVYKVEITVSHLIAQDGNIIAKVNGREQKKWTFQTPGEEYTYTLDVVSEKDGIAEISLEHRSNKKRRSRYPDRSRLFSITVKEK